MITKINVDYSFLQSVQVAKDVVFPSRILKRQLEDAQHRLKEMEEELILVKSQEMREKKRRKKMRVSLSHQMI